MSLKHEAALLDAQDRPIEAAQAYEAVIASSAADLDEYINLAVLYFLCNDGGYAAQHQLPMSFLDGTWRRAFEVLDEASQRYGEHPEIIFWRRYFDFILLGEEPFYEDCERLVKAGNTIIPYFYLFGFQEGRKYLQQAEELYNLVKAEVTAKERYIKSILGGAFKRLGFKPS